MPPTDSSTAAGTSLDRVLAEPLPLDDEGFDAPGEALLEPSTCLGIQIHEPSNMPISKVFKSILRPFGVQRDQFALINLDGDGFTLD